MIFYEVPAYFFYILKISHEWLSTCQIYILFWIFWRAISPAQMPKQQKEIIQFLFLSNFVLYITAYSTS